MPNPYVNPQAVSLDQFLNGLEQLLAYWTQLDPTHVVEYYGDDRPQYEGESLLTVGIPAWNPAESPGAGPLANDGTVTVAVRVYTRYLQDTAGFDTSKFRNTDPNNPQRGHWVTVLAALQAMNSGSVLWTKYVTKNLAPPTPPTPAGVQSTYSQPRQQPVPDTWKPKPHQGYLITELRWEIDWIKPIWFQGLT